MENQKQYYLSPEDETSTFIKKEFTKLIILFFLFSIGFLETLNAQSNFWHKYSHRDQNFVIAGDEEGKSIHQLQSGNYLLIGNVEKYGSSRGIIKKVNPDGIELWSKLFDSTLQFSTSVLCDNGVNVSIAGTRQKTFGSLNNLTPQIIKCDTNGTILWNHEYADSTTSYFAFDIIESKSNGTIDGLVLLTGSLADGYLITKVNSSNGTVTYSRKYDDYLFGSVVICTNIIQTSDENYVCTGANINDGYMIKVNSSNGNFLWQNNYSITSVPNSAIFTDVIEAPYNGALSLIATFSMTPTNSVICAANSESGGIMIFSLEGDTVKDARITCNDRYTDLIYEKDTFFISGFDYTDNVPIVSKFKLMPTMSKKRYPYTVGLSAEFSQIIHTSDNGFALVGTGRENGDAFGIIQKTDSSLNSGCGFEDSTVGPFSATVTISGQSILDSAFTADATQNANNTNYTSYTEINCDACDQNTALTLSQNGVHCEFMDSIKLTATSTYPYFFYVWRNFSTGDSVVTTSDTLWVTKNGNYQVTGRYNWKGCFKKSGFEKVKFFPKITTGFSHTLGACGDLASFTDTSSVSFGKILIRYWNFDEPSSGQDSIGFGASTSHDYADTGNYSVRLILYTDEGCSDTITKTVNITGVNAYPLTIISGNTDWKASGNAFSAVLNPFPAPQYGQFQWYRDGNPIEDDTCYCPTLSTRYPGEYLLRAFGDCGWEMSNKIEIKPACDDPALNTTLSGSNIPAGFYVATGGYYISGDIEINSGDTVEFNSTALIMDDCVRVTVKPGGHLILDSVVVSSCNNWQGLIVDKDITGNGFLEMYRSHVSYATVGVLSKNGAKVQCDKDTFENNYTHIGILGENDASQDSVRIVGSFFGRVRKDFTTITQSCGHDDWDGIIKYKNLAGDTDRWRPYVFIDKAQDVVIGGSEFALDEFYRPPAPDTIPLNLYNGRIALISTNSSEIDIVENNFRVVTERHVLVKDITSYISKVRGNRFNGGLASNFLGNLVTGVYVEDADSLNIHGNNFNDYDRAIEFYGSGNEPDTIYDNRIENCDVGLAVAPAEFPINIDSTANTSTATIKLQIHCNRFSGNTIAIAGSGNMENQQAGFTQNDADAGNKFVSNVDWDIVWQDSDTDHFTYFTSNFSDQPNQSTNNPAIFINSIQVTNSNHIDSNRIFVLALNSSPLINDNSCRAFLKTDPNIFTAVEPAKEAVTEPAKLYPNPFNSSITIELKEEAQQGNIVVFDILGKKVLQQKFSGVSTQIPTSGLSPGFYVVMVIDGGAVLHTEKMIKAQR